MSVFVHPLLVAFLSLCGAASVLSEFEVRTGEVGRGEVSDWREGGALFCKAHEVHHSN